VEEDILTENQTLLTGYLAAIGCQTEAILHIIMKLWYEEPVIAMLKFCRDNPKASQAQLLKASSEIYSKYKSLIDSEDKKVDEMWKAVAEAERAERIQKAAKRKAEAEEQATTQK